MVLLDEWEILYSCLAVTAIAYFTINRSSSFESRQECVLGGRLWWKFVDVWIQQSK